jgi:quinol monooxygenase YgiN
MEATNLLFSDYASDHRSTLFGEVSEQFLNLVEERMGAAPEVFSFLQGVEPGATRTATSIRTTTSDWLSHALMGHLEVHAHLRIRPGKLDGFKAQAGELVRLAREKDTETIRYDWFVNQDGTVCEVHEGYRSGQGLIDHNTHIMDARATLFEEYAYDHRMAAFGEVSQELRELGHKHAGGIVVYSFLQGLETGASV